MQRATGRHVAADLNVLANFRRGGGRVFDGNDLLTLVGYQDRCLARIDALLGAGRVSGISTLCPAFRVANPPRHAHVLWSRPGGQVYKTHHHCHCKYFLHGNLRCLCDLKPLPRRPLYPVRPIAPFVSTEYHSVIWLQKRRTPTITARSRFVSTLSQVTERYAIP